MRIILPTLAAVVVSFVAHAEPTKPAPPVTGKVFEDIYRHAKWGTNDSGTGNSGTGSTLHATLLYRTFLQQFLKDNDIRSVVDAGCGDWEFSQALDWTGIDYKGFDIVEAVVAQDTKKYANHAKLGSVFAFLILGIDARAGTVVVRLVPILADVLLEATVIQHHWAGRVSRGVTQLTGRFDRVLGPSFRPRIDMEQARAFLLRLLGE